MRFHQQLITSPLHTLTDITLIDAARADASTAAGAYRNNANLHASWRRLTVIFSMPLF